MDKRLKQEVGDHTNSALNTNPSNGPNSATVAVASVTRLSTLSQGIIISLLVFVGHQLYVFKKKKARQKAQYKYMEIEDTVLQQSNASDLATKAT